MNKFSMFPLFSSLNSLCMSTDKCRYKLIGWLILCCFMLEHFPNECVEKKIHGLKISCGWWSENIIFLVEKLSRSQLKVYGLLIINSCGLALILYFASTVHCDLLKKKRRYIVRSNLSTSLYPCDRLSHILQYNAYKPNLNMAWSIILADFWWARVALNHCVIFLSAQTPGSWRSALRGWRTSLRWVRLTRKWA